MPVRNVECGMRNELRQRPLRIPHSALCILLAACSPVTTRPPFQPLPEALVVTVNAPPARVAAAAAAWLAGEGLIVVQTSPRDGYVETAWYDAHTKATHTGGGDVPDLAGTVKLRCW